MQEILHYPKLTPHSALVNSGRLAKALSLKRFGDLLLHRLVHQVELPAFGDIQRQKESGATGSSCSFPSVDIILRNSKNLSKWNYILFMHCFFCVGALGLFVEAQRGSSHCGM